MTPYLKLLEQAMSEGHDELNRRTGKICRTLIGPSIKLDCSNGFNAITTKKLAFRSVVAELLGFMRGYTNAAQFRELGTKIWDANANETSAWLENPYRKGFDDLGNIYGKQWVDWEVARVVKSEQEERILDADRSWDKLVLSDGTKPGVYRKSINQLKEIVRKLLTDPSDRRIILSAWNVGELDMMALPPCHMDYRFVSLGNKDSDRRTLHVVMTMRSTDLYLGLPFNIASTNLLLEIFARLTDHDVGTLTIQMTNAHIYEDHFAQVEKQLTIKPLHKAGLDLPHNLVPLTLETLESFEFSSIQPEDISLNGYGYIAWDSSAPMAV